MDCDQLEAALLAVVKKTEITYVEDGSGNNLPRFSYAKIRGALSDEWDAVEIDQMFAAVDSHRIWPDDGTGLVDPGKLMVSWKAAVRHCRGQDIGL